MKKNVSVNEMDVVLANEPETKQIQISDDVFVTVKTHLTLEERRDICQFAVDACFPDSEEAGEPMYSPYLFKVAFGWALLENATDIRLPKSHNKINAIIESSVWDKVVDTIGFSKVVELEGRAWEMVNYKKEQLLSDIRAASRDLVRMLDNVANGMSGLDDMFHQIGIEDLQKAVKAVSTINPDDIAVAVQRMKEEV